MNISQVILTEEGKKVKTEGSSMLDTLVTKLINKAQRRDLKIDEETATDEINSALLEYYNDRHYTPTDDKPYEEIYSDLIVQLALSSIAKAGAEGETSHSEGGVSRTYDNASDYPLALTRKIIPLVKGVDLWEI